MLTPSPKKPIFTRRLHGAALAVSFFLAALSAQDAQALALGRITVQSALGEPLRAEIDLPEITPIEAANLKVSMASAEAFKAAGLEYNSVVPQVQMSVQRRGNGAAYIQLSSDRAINEPFVDLILEANWPFGRILRDYTLLLDPPNLRAKGSTPTTVPSSTPITQAQLPSSPPPAWVSQRPLPEATPVPAREMDRSSANGPKVKVKTGDTAGRIAAAYKPATLSLEQMLAALVQANPDAFIGGNINRIKAGAVLTLPNESVVPATEEAPQTIQAQSRDFNEFKNQLATRAPAVPTTVPEREASGKIEAKVEEKKPAAATQDKLTLSKGTSANDIASAEKIAQEKQAQDASTRVAQLEKNIADLQKLAAATGPAPTASGATSTSKAPGASTAGQAASSSSAPAIAAPTPAPATSQAANDAAMEDSIWSHWLTWLLGSLALLGLVLAGVNRMRQQRKLAHDMDSSFLGSRLPMDSFFDESGGQRVDTTEDGNSSASSMAYSPSQLDAGGDVDLLAEAEIYLAYGRDQQAEEILKEAVRITPTRTALHVKLLEIYAKRQDTSAFNARAQALLELTQGQGSEWTRIAELGRSLDPQNALYFVQENASAAPAAPEEEAETTQLPTAPSPDDELDLDFSQATSEAAKDKEAKAPVAPVSRFDFSTATIAMRPTTAPAKAAPVNDKPAATTPPPTPNATPPEPPAVTAADEPAKGNESGLLEFDLSGLSLDLPNSDDDMPTTPVSDAQALATKFALAQEFAAIGDEDGARALAQEVLRQATGELKAQAKKFLDELGD